MPIEVSKDPPSGRHWVWKGAHERAFRHPAARLAQWLGEAILGQTLRGLQYGQLDIETPSGERLVFEGTRAGFHAQLKIHKWRCLWRLATSSDLGLADAYAAGEWSSPNLVALLKLANDNEASINSLRAPRPRLKLRHALNRNTRSGSRRNISAHYDLGNEFYEQWLDNGMSYSAGLYTSAGQTLEDAQNAKLERVLDLLAMSGGETALEIGFGWGGLAERLLERSDSTLTGLTLSTEQLAYAQRRLVDRGLLGRSDLRLQDYRDVRNTFDRIVSIEMLEAVGEAYWPAYFDRLRGCLRPGGIAVLQVITINKARFDIYRRKPDFIQKYIFPGGMLPTEQIIEYQVEKAGLKLVTKELFGESYARTLEAWQQRFQKSWPRVEAMGFDERFKRIWEYYLAYCRTGFETGALNVGLYKMTR